MRTIRRFLAWLTAQVIADDPYQAPPDDDDDPNDPPATDLPALPLPPDAPAEDVAAWEREMARRRRMLRQGRDAAIVLGGQYGGGFEALAMTRAALVDALDDALEHAYWQKQASAQAQQN